MTDQPATKNPEQVGALQNRLRLAHQARRAKEHQLDDIRRALCDIGFMDDDDPYSHADLADVIRQVGRALESGRLVDPARTTPDNPTTSSDDPDNPLREQLDEARTWARHGYEIGQKHCGWSDHGVAPDWLTEGWPHHFDSCEHLQQMAQFDETLTRVRAVCDQLRRASVLADGQPHTDRERGIMQAVERVLRAINQPATPDTGPSVAEAAANDRRWDLERHGE